jgi:hypothetical protein
MDEDKKKTDEETCKINEAMQNTFQGHARSIIKEDM